MRTLGDRVGQPLDERARLDVEVVIEAVDLRQHARDRREECEAIELGLVDLGEVGA